MKLAQQNEGQIDENQACKQRGTYQRAGVAFCFSVMLLLVGCGNSVDRFIIGRAGLSQDAVQAQIEQTNSGCPTMIAPRRCMGADHQRAIPYPANAMVWLELFQDSRATSSASSVAVDYLRLYARVKGEDKLIGGNEYTDPGEADCGALSQWIETGQPYPNDLQRNEGTQVPFTSLGRTAYVRRGQLFVRVGMYPFPSIARLWLCGARPSIPHGAERVWAEALVSVNGKAFAQVGIDYYPLTGDGIEAGASHYQGKMSEAVLTFNKPLSISLPPPGQVPNEGKYNFVLTYPGQDNPRSSDYWEGFGYWDGTRTVALYNFNCGHFSGHPAILYIGNDATGRWDSFPGRQINDQTCVFDAPVGNGDAVTIGFENREPWYYFVWTGACVEKTQDHAYIRLLKGCRY